MIVIASFFVAGGVRKPTSPATSNVIAARAAESSSGKPPLRAAAAMPL